MKGKLKWALACILALLAGVVAAQSFKQYFYPTNGTISTIGVSVTWLDGSSVTEFNWGSVENGTAYVMDPVNITNIENTNVTLSLNTTDWSATVIDLTLTWNYTGAILPPTESVIVELEQVITGTGDWTYTTVITATEA